MNIRRVMRFLLFAIALGAILFSGSRLLGYYKETSEGAAVTQNLTEIALSPVASSPSAEPETAEVTGEEEAQYDEYAPFTVDFEALWAESPDVVAWLYCEDTPINYPIVQGDDNEFYVEHLPDGTWNGVGTLFLDFINEPDFSDFHSIIYGHNMLNDSMFGVVTDYYRQEYYEAHPVMYLMTPEQYYKVELVGGVVTPVDSWLYDLDFTDPAKKVAFLDEINQKSTFIPAAQYGAEDRFLTLSTCTYDFENARYLLTGKLVPVGGALEDTGEIWEGQK